MAKKKKVKKKVKAKKKFSKDYECSLCKKDFQITKHIDFTPRRYSVDCIYWENNRWVVTDGQMLILIEGKGIPKIENPIRLDGRGMLEMFKRLKKHNTIESVTVAYNKVTFSGSGLTYDISLLTEGRFPDYEKSISMSKKKAPWMTFDAARLSKVLSYFPDFIKDHISSQISFDDQKIRISCTDGGMEREAIIMGTGK